MLVAVELVIAASARKHGVSDEESATPTHIPFASSNSTRDSDVIGANQAAIIYEIGVVDGVAAPVVVHAMKARDKFLR